MKRKAGLHFIGVVEKEGEQEAKIHIFQKYQIGFSILPKINGELIGQRQRAIPQP
jgi:hypothetical protein